MELFIPLVWLILFQHSAYGQFDPCQPGNHVQITGDERSDQLTTDQSLTPLCDRFRVVEGNYYVFDNSIGAKIPETCPPINHCQTHAPIWLSGSHPTIVNSEVARKVCGNHGYDGTFFESLCCEWEAPIKIKLCPGINGGSNFYAYRLVPPNGCDSAYCGGSRKLDPVCPSNQELRGGKCENICPVLTEDPVLSNPVQLPHTVPQRPPNDWQFTCRVRYSEILKDGERLAVRWVFDGKNDTSVPVTVLDRTTGLTATLKGTQIDGHMGTNVQCAVRSYSGSEFCTEKFSNPYRMEIRAVTDTAVQPFIINNVGTFRKTIGFETTIPPTCPENRLNCVVNIQVVTKEQDNPIQTIRVCTVSIDSTAWNSQTNSARSTKSFEVSTVKNTCGNKEEDFVLRMSTVNRIGRTPFKNYAIGDLRFRFNRTSGAICKSTNDPWIKTFDSYWYGTVKIGEFYLVRNEANRFNRFEIQVRMNTCGTMFGSCNCAVSMREGNTVLSIDVCNPNLDAPVLWAYPEELTPGAAIYRINSETYRLCVPSGSCTKVVILTSEEGFRKWIDIFIENLPSNIGPISGLCGNLDGNWMNDQTLAFTIEPYRIKRNGSFFDGNIPLMQGAAPEPFERCTCLENEGNEIQCGTPPSTSCQGSQNGVPVDPSSIFQLKNIWSFSRKKRLTPDGDNKKTFEDIRYTFEYGENDSRNSDGLRWPTPSGTTQAQARQLCQSDIQTAAAFEQCKAEIGDTAYNSLIEQCVSDFKITDSIEISGRIWETLQEECKAVVRSGDRGESLQQAIVAQTCPGKCTGQGTCSNSVCVCNNGYIGPDCSVRSDTPPAVTGLQEKGLCDVERRPCLRISLYSKGGKFVDLSSTTCRVTIKQAQNGIKSAAIVMSTVETKATFISKWEIFCELPESDVLSREAVYSDFEVSLSYDGSLFSTPLNVKVYTSMCMQCSNPHSCSFKLNACEIERCFSAACEPTETAPTEKPEENKINLYLVIGVTIACVTIMLLVIAGLIALCCWKKREPPAVPAPAVPAPAVPERAEPDVYEMPIVPDGASAKYEYVPPENMRRGAVNHNFQLLKSAEAMQILPGGNKYEFEKP